MKMKKALALLLTLIMALSLVACGGGEKTEEPKTEEPKAEEPAGNEESTGGFDGTYKIGSFMPLTGNSSMYGDTGDKAARLAAKQINEAGGILGKEVVIVSYDDKSSPEEAVKSVNKMLEVDQVDAILGSIHSGNIQACGDMIEEAKVPLVGTGTSPQWLEKGWTYLFRCTLNTYYSSLSAIQACEALGVKTIGIFHSQDEYGKNGKDNMEALCEEYGIEIVVVESMKPGDSDLTAQCAKISEANPDAVYMIAVGNELPLMTKQIRAGGVDGIIIGEQNLGAPEVKEIAGDAADGLVFGAAFVMPQNEPSEAGIPEVVDFFQAYLEEYGEMCPTEVGARAYDGVYLLKEAAEKAGSVDGTAVRDAMYTLKYDGLQGHFDFSVGAGEGLTASRLYIIDGGKDVLLDEWMAANK